ncbi:MAG: ATP-binding protein [Acidimicrobiales bacterium]
MPIDVLLKMRSGPDPVFVTEARHHLCDAMEGCHQRCIDDAQLVLGELMSNAVEHAHSVIDVSVARMGDALRIEVDDDDRTGQPRVLHPDPTSETGRGLLIVERVALRWGVERHWGDGKTLWAELAC